MSDVKTYEILDKHQRKHTIESDDIHYENGVLSVKMQKETIALFFNPAYIQEAKKKEKES